MSGRIHTFAEENETESKKRITKGDGQKTYYTLGIVLDRDINNGSFWPSYILCSSVTSSDKRSGWRVVKQFDGKAHFNLPKVLVTSIYGHDDMLDYLALYRTQDTFKGLHYYPSGALCWFESNQYGEPTGSVFYVRKIPDKKLLELPIEQRGYKKLKKQQNQTKKLKDIFKKERPDMIQF